MKEKWGRIKGERDREGKIVVTGTLVCQYEGKQDGRRASLQHCLKSLEIIYMTYH